MNLFLSIILIIYILFAILYPFLFVFLAMFIIGAIIFSRTVKNNKGYIDFVVGFEGQNKCVVYFYEDKITIDDIKIIPITRIRFVETLKTSQNIHMGYGRYTKRIYYHLKIHFINKDGLDSQLLVSTKMNASIQGSLFDSFCDKVNKHIGYKHPSKEKQSPYEL